MGVPLTALFAEDVLVDATACSDEEWVRVHRARPRAELRCRGCDAAMHAKVSSAGLRFFAHDHQQSACPSNGESSLHRWLKHCCAEAIRGAGWEAVVEAQRTESDRGGWRADVLAVGPASKRVAFEVQLASMTLDEGRFRTAQYATDGVDSVWVAIREPLWLYKLQSLKVGESEQRTIDPARRGEIVVSGGAARLKPAQPDWWDPWVGAPLVEMIGQLLRGEAIWYPVGYWIETVPWGEKERDNFYHRATMLVPRADAAACDAYRKAERERRAHETEQRQRHQANTAAVIARQRRLLSVAIVDAINQCASYEGVWIGVPPVRFDGEIPTTRALGNERTGAGAAVWIGNQPNLRLFAVVCPVASRIATGLAASWRNRGVRVYVADGAEAGRVSRALGWPRERLVIPDS